MNSRRIARQLMKLAKQLEGGAGDIPPAALKVAERAAKKYTSSKLVLEQRRYMKNLEEFVAICGFFSYGEEEWILVVVGGDIGTSKPHVIQDYGVIGYDMQGEHDLDKVVSKLVLQYKKLGYQ